MCGDVSSAMSAFDSMQLFFPATTAYFFAQKKGNQSRNNNGAAYDIFQETGLGGFHFELHTEVLSLLVFRMMYRAGRLFIGIFSCMSDDFIGQNNIDIINKNLLTFL